MASKETTDRKPIPLKKRLLSEELNVPAGGASFIKDRWIWD
ncbi:MAG: hypothetical protein QOJ91_2554 [Sphingomonadales bacterium]|jgi:hypothetical protein|nr:hypothetical protein [Sphingomonadales bacterium]